MTKTQKPTPDSRPRRDRFIEAAQLAGAEDDEAAFRAKLAVIARHISTKEIPPLPAPEIYQRYTITPHASELESTWVAMITAPDGWPTIMGSGIGRTCAEAIVKAREIIDEALGIST